MSTIFRLLPSSATNYVNFRGGWETPPEGEECVLNGREYDAQFDSITTLSQGCILKRTPILPPWKLLHSTEVRGSRYPDIFEVSPFLIVSSRIKRVLEKIDSSFLQWSTLDVLNEAGSAVGTLEYYCIHFRRVISFPATVAPIPKIDFIPSDSEKSVIALLSSNKLLYESIGQIPFWQPASAMSGRYFNSATVDMLTKTDPELEALFKEIPILAK